VRLPRLEVDVIPRKTEQLAAPKPEDEHEDVARVQGVVVATCGLEEQSSLGDTPDGELLCPRDGDSDETSHVAGDQLLSHGGAEGAAEHGPGLVHGPLRPHLVAAHADSAASRHGSGSILALRAALAPNTKLVEPGLNVPHGQFVEPLYARDPARHRAV